MSPGPFTSVIDRKEPGHHHVTGSVRSNTGRDCNDSEQSESVGSTTLQSPSPINCNAPLHFARGLSVTLVATSPSTERNEPGRYVVTGSVVHFGGSTERDEPGRCIVTGSDV
jgi:DsbC/DsbD-like thiol-disulfide interchange protein